MTEKQLEHDMLMQFIIDDCYVNTKKSVEYPPVALSFGEKLIKQQNRRLFLANSYRHLWKSKCSNSTS